MLLFFVKRADFHPLFYFVGAKLTKLKNKLSLNVLIIENSEILNERYTRLLSPLNSVDMLTHSPLSEKTFEFVKNQQPEVIIIAQDIDASTYIKSLKRLRQNHPNVFIIILSAKSFPQLFKKYKEWGADFILDKSTEFNKLPKVFQELNSENTN